MATKKKAPAKAEAKTPAKKPGRPRIHLEEPVRVRCITDNIWLTTGQLHRGEVGVESNAPALKMMLERGDVEIVE